MQSTEKEHPVHSASAMKTFLNSASRNASPFGPLGNRQSLSVVFNESVVPCVAALLFACRPSHIARLVVPVIVDAIKFVARRWALAHILKERLKRLSPAVAHFYAATAVVLVVAMCWKCASSDCIAPQTIQARFREAMRARCCSAHIIDQASAAFDAAVLEVVSGNESLSPAFAAATPNVVAATIPPCEPFNGQAVESPSGEVEGAVVVFRRDVRLARINDSHDATLLIRVAKWLEPADVSASVPARFILTTS